MGGEVHSDGSPALPSPPLPPQLKIENSALNEKVEDRNEELGRLRKKTVTAVQASRGEDGGGEALGQRIGAE